MTTPVTLERIGHAFGGFRALTDIDLKTASGKYVTLLGPSGCGKTTLLSVLGDFLQPDIGRVLIGGRDVTALPAAKCPTATLFQDYALFPHMSLRDNVAFGPHMAGMARTARNALAEEKLDLVGLRDAASKRPSALSGGQRQRVALARALAVEPDVLLLDEPLGALELKLRRAMQDELKNIQRRVGTIFVHVIHDQEEAMAIADRIVVMHAGRVEDAGAPDRIYRAPASLSAAGFMGETNRFMGEARQGRIATPFGEVDMAPPAAGRLTLCIRPEAVRPGAGPLRIGPATVVNAAFFGTHCCAHLRPDAVSDLTPIAHLPPGRVPEPGEILDLSGDIADLNAFAAE